MTYAAAPAIATSWVGFNGSHIVLEKLPARFRPARIGGVAHEWAVDHYLRLGVRIERGVNGGGSAHGVDEADAVDRFALELAGEVDGVEVGRRLEGP